MEVGLGPGHIVLDADPDPPGKGHSLQISAHVCCGQTAGWIKMPLGTKVGLGPGHIVLHRDPDPSPKRGTPPILGPCLLWPNGRPSQLLLSTCIGLLVYVKTNRHLMHSIFINLQSAITFSLNTVEVFIP